MRCFLIVKQASIRELFGVKTIKKFPNTKQTCLLSRIIERKGPRQRVLSFLAIGSVVDQFVVDQLPHPGPDAVHAPDPFQLILGFESFGEALGVR